MVERSKTILDIFSDRNFLVLWMEMFVSTTASYLAILATSAKVFASTNSHFSAGSVFAVTWLMPLMFVSGIVSINRRYESRTLLICGEACFALLCLGLVFVAESLMATLLIFLARGLVEGVVKSARMRALKTYIAQDKLEQASSLFGTSNFLGIGIGALLGAALVERISLPSIYIITLVLFFMMSAVSSLFPKVSDEVTRDRGDTSGIFQVIQNIRDYGLTTLSLQWVLVVMAFQGFHNIARTAYGIEFFALDLDGISYIQIITTAAVTGGAIFVAKFLTGSQAPRLAPKHAITMTCGCMAVLPFMPNAWFGFGLYFLFIFLFEVSFVRVQNEIVTRCPSQFSGTILSFLNAVLIGSMAGGVFLFGVLVDEFGFRVVSIASAGVIAILGQAIALSFFGPLHPRTEGS